MQERKTTGFPISDARFQSRKDFYKSHLTIQDLRYSFALKAQRKNQKNNSLSSHMKIHNTPDTSIRVYWTEKPPHIPKDKQARV